MQYFSKSSIPVFYLFKKHRKLYFFTLQRSLYLLGTDELYFLLWSHFGAAILYNKQFFETQDIFLVSTLNIWKKMREIIPN